MRREFSTYLDAVRFGAAMCVVAAHFTFSQFIAGVPYQGAMAGCAVSIFFVLSGYVIAYVADQKEHTLRQFAVSRLARIYSVAIPAIALTLAIDFYMLHHGAGQRLPLYEYRGLWKYLPVFLIFGGDIAGFHAPVFSDGVFWSLSYEVWYYVAFGAFFYLRGAWRLGVGLAALLILGVPALLYFPTWLLGCVIYVLHKRIQIEPRRAVIGALVTAAMAVGLLVLGFYDWIDDVVNAALGGWPVSQLHNSMHFPSHYVVATLTAAHLFFVQYCKLQWLDRPSVRATIVYLASFTFAIYLSHRPFMNIWTLLLGHNPNSIGSIVLLACLVLGSCWCFGLLSEHQKNRWRTLFRWMLGVPVPDKMPGHFPNKVETAPN